MPTRRERMSGRSEKRARQMKTRRNLWISAGIAAAVVLATVAIALSGVLTPSTAAPASSPVAVTGSCSAVQSFPTLNQDHIQPDQPHPPYSSNPPTSGWHWDNAQEWGIYTTPQVQEQLVHNLEHGGIIIQYNNLTAGEVQQLADLVKQDSHHMILAPYPGLPSDVKIALTAWNHLQTCIGVNENAVKAFVNAFRDKGPERVP